ncbi:hypothetical protein [Dongshaea marina]|uniref:hypothetical protein n=1 Tax=Dongshaea marina TaxID=2047966 RepID=UPI000D3E8036|nr:hypothetical protein [Dongshaea marina]
MTDWLLRARKELSKNAPPATDNSDERALTSVMAVGQSDKSPEIEPSKALFPKSMEPFGLSKI